MTAFRMMFSISRRSSSERSNSAAGAVPSIWSGLLAPTIAISTAGLASVQATASWATVWPRSSANFFSSSTVSRFLRKFSRRKEVYVAGAEEAQAVLDALPGPVAHPRDIEIRLPKSCVTHEAPF